jgi:hypothetical protein
MHCIAESDAQERAFCLERKLQEDIAAGITTIRKILSIDKSCLAIHC